MSTPPELFTARVKKVRNAENEAAFMQQAQHTDLKEVSDILVIPCLYWCVLLYYINFFSLIFYKLKQIAIYHK